MRIAIAQLNYHIGNFEGNLQKMLDAVEKAKKEKADLICFSELCTCGYPPRDFLEFNDFIRKCYHSVDVLRAASEDIAIVVGSPYINSELEGKNLHNCAFFLYEGEVQNIARKALLPTYDIFDEYRYFEPGKEFEVVKFKGYRIALTICEDIWDVPLNPEEPELDDPLYNFTPLDEMIDQEPDLILNLSASPFSYAKVDERKEVIRANVKRYDVPLIYVNHVGAQTELIFDGGSIVMSTNGIIHDEMPYFEEDFRVYDMASIQEGLIHSENHLEKVELIHQALLVGIKDYFRKLGFSKATLGLSGGIDSAVTAVLAAQALGPENVKVLLMPSHFSSDHSVNDALDLVRNLGIEHEILEIEDIYHQYINILEPVLRDTEFNVTEENIQARIRGTLLMALSNKHGYILLNTSNKSEMAVGYGTLYGDLAGGLSILGDVYKTEVFRLAEHLNTETEIIPRNIIDKAPSAELRPNQKDSDSLPEYDILDEILFQYVERRQGPKEIIAMGYDDALVRRILRLVNINEFKRYQTAPVLRVSPKAFGMGRRMPIVGKYLA
jgi:NAD+ synthase (glutamine-hydrolysing)